MNLRDMQFSQPWTVQYSAKFADAASMDCVPHLYATHAVLHAMKSLGKIAAVLESMDHRRTSMIELDENDTIKAMSADLVTVAMRLGNLFYFDLETVLRDRVKEKNGVGFRETDT